MNAWVLTTAARVQQFIGGTFTASQTTVIESLIDSVTAYIENYCGRRFKQTTYTNEEYDGDGSGFIVLKQFPVSSVSLKYRNTSSNEADWSTVDTKDYFVDTDSGVIQLAGNSKFTKGIKTYAVTYTGGWNFDNVATFLSVYAADLEFVVWKLVSTAFNQKAGDVGISSESIGDYSVTYSKEVFENSEIKAILDKYSKKEVRGIPSPLNY